jgi:phosphatidylglycerophosphate synthase
MRDALAATRGAQKTSKGGPAYSVLVNRRIGRLFAATAYVLGRTPNQVTALSAMFTFTAIATIAIARPTVITAVGASLLLIIGYALDSADGQLARLRGGGSVVGEWLDHVVDSFKIASTSIHLAVLLSWYRYADASDAQLLIPIAFEIVASVMFFVIMLNDRLRRAHRGTTDVLLEGSSPLLYRLAVLPTDYGFLCVAFSLLFWQTGFPWIYGGLAAANLAFLMLALVKWYREMKTHG